MEATKQLQPTFGHELGNTWLTCPATQQGTLFGNCSFTTAAEWRACYGANIAKQTALLQAASPHLMISSGLMEFLAKDNLDDPADFERCCKPGTIGQWGGNNTCVPDVTTKCIQDYYTKWGKVFLDAGSRALFFGQSRLTGGAEGCAPDRTGCSRVSHAGAAGFGVIFAALKVHASAQGYGEIYFGPQAASGFQLANGTELASWVYGGQHLHASQRWLVQPFSLNGTNPPPRPAVVRRCRFARCQPCQQCKHAPGVAGL